jgi:hypothetical protein
MIRDAPRITIRYVDGCPDWAVARDRAPSVARLDAALCQ